MRNHSRRTRAVIVAFPSLRAL